MKTIKSILQVTITAFFIATFFFAMRGVDVIFFRKEREELNKSRMLSRAELAYTSGFVSGMDAKERIANGTFTNAQQTLEFFEKSKEQFLKGVTW